MTEELTTNKPEFIAPVLTEITSNEQYQAYALILIQIKRYKERVSAFFRPHKERTRAAWQGVVDDEKLLLSHASPSEFLAKQHMAIWLEKQERARRAEEARLAEIARAQEETRRLELAAAMELEADRTGDDDLRQQAQEVAEEVTETPAVSLQSYVPKVSGITQRGSYAARVTDLKKLVAYVAKHPKEINLLRANEPALNALARSQKENLRIPGVQLVKGSIIGASAR